MSVSYPIHGGSVILDEDSVGVISGSKWRTDRQGYAIRTIHWREDGVRHTSTQFMHRIIMAAQRGQIVDHINRIKSDNRKCNLRFVTVRENTRNIANPKFHPYDDVRRTPSGRWEARVSVRGKVYYLGHFENPHDGTAAANSVRQASANGRPVPSKQEARLAVLGAAAMAEARARGAVGEG